MKLEDFLNGKPVELEAAGHLSSYALVLVELGLKNHGKVFGEQMFPPVLGYRFDWGLLKVYRVDDWVIWHFHFLPLMERLEVVERTADDLVMTCLAYFNMDCWLGGQSFWNDKGWPHGNSIWQRGGKRPNIEICTQDIPSYLSFEHGSETESLSLVCEKPHEKQSINWIGKVFLPVILKEMVAKVEKALMDYKLPGSPQNIR